MATIINDKYKSLPARLLLNPLRHIGRGLFGVASKMGSTKRVNQQ